VRFVAHAPANTYFPYLPTSAAATARSLPTVGLFCAPREVLEEFDSGAARETFAVAWCQSRWNRQLHIDGNIEVRLFGDDPNHVFEVVGTLQGAPTPEKRTLLAQAVTTAAGAAGDEELLSWMTTVADEDASYETDRMLVTLLDPDAPTFVAESTGSESIRRAFESASPGNSLDAIPPARLARAFAPTFRFHDGDFLPLSISELPGRAQLCVKVGSSAPTACRPFTEFPATRPQRPANSRWVLDLPGATEGRWDAYAAIERELRETGSQPVVYWHVAKLGYRRVLQYWTYYLYNGWENDHEGDWETVMVDLMGWDSPDVVSPLRWFYSVHERGTISTCAAGACVHPVVHVAHGSHANYFDAGVFEVTARCNARGYCFVPPGRDDATGDFELGPGDYDLVELTGPAFAGRYGPKNVVPFVRDGEAPDDPRLHPEWESDPLKRFAEATGLEPERRSFYKVDVEAAEKYDDAARR
jgi:hypothetical protein